MFFIQRAADFRKPSKKYIANSVIVLAVMDKPIQFINFGFSPSPFQFLLKVKIQSSSGWSRSSYCGKG